MAELTALYPSFEALRDSTAAARLNGYLALHGSLEDFVREEPTLELTPGLSRKIREVLGERSPEGR